MAKVITVGSIVFPSQKAALDFIRAVRDEYEDGERINATHQAFLHELLLLHSESAEKIGSGIQYFTVTTEREFGRTRHFVVVRTDGSSTDFSFNNCVKGANPRADRLQALRVAVAEEVATFKNKAFAGGSSVSCAVRGVQTPFRDADVDHTPPKTFAKLVERWLSRSGIDLGDVAVSPAADNQIVSTMGDQRQLRSWQAFHKKHAELRIVCRAANLSDVRTQ